MEGFSFFQKYCWERGIKEGRERGESGEEGWAQKPGSGPDCFDVYSHPCTTSGSNGLCNQRLSIFTFDCHLPEARTGRSYFYLLQA